MTTMTTMTTSPADSWFCDIRAHQAGDHIYFAFKREVVPGRLLNRYDNPVGQL
jgi:hypothetical protein